ncbi:MAG TPA: lipopolysaccharide heptosyltransferase II [Nitrospinota bacterium]|nr:lipopolysaccharide heptosyltransferase II [Nitrospinota bacterium]
MNNPIKILIVGPSWIGDMVIAQSLFKFIKTRNQRAEIDVIAPDWTVPLLTRMPEVNNTIPLPQVHGKLLLGLRRRISYDLRKQQYGHAIILPRSFKSAIIPFIARAKRRTGYLGEMRWGLLNDIRKLNKETMPRTVDRFISLALELGDGMPFEVPFPSLMVEPQNISAILARLGEQVPTSPILGLCPGAEYGSSKRWPAKCFAEVANEKLKDGWHVWLFGSEKDTAATTEILTMTQNHCLNLAGKTSLTESIDLMSLTKAVVTNDSGLMHIAAALEKHTIAIYGSSDPKQTPPLNDKANILYLDLSCSPCFKRECPLEHLNCLNDLKPEMVLDALPKIKD